MRRPSNDTVNTSARNNRRIAPRSLPYHWLLPLAFFCVGLTYLYASPHFESPDSYYHLGVIKWIADHGGALPIQSPDHEHLYAHEGSQPPLYYLLMTPIWAAIDSADFADFFQANPLVIAGHPARLGNRNQIFYRQPHPPNLAGASLALYLIRLASLAMGTVTIFAIYQAARKLAPASTGLAVLAASFAAFNPQFLFISSSISNDNLVAMLAALTTWMLIAMLRDGFHTRRSVFIGLLVALASLAKLSGLILGLVVILCGCYIAWRTRDRRGLLILAASLFAFWLALAGWWYLRNIALYGELFGTGALIEHFGGRNATLLQLLTQEFEGFRISYWGLFGWFSIFTSPLHYAAMDILSALAIVGLAIHMLRNRAGCLCHERLRGAHPAHSRRRRRLDLVFDANAVVARALDVSIYRRYQSAACAGDRRPEIARAARRPADVRLQHRRAISLYHPAI